MSGLIVVGPISKGFTSNPLAFNIDNDAFPFLQNAYEWRGRLKRKRGTSLLGRLQRVIGTTDAGGNATITIAPVPIASGIVEFMIGTDIFTDQGGASPVTMITNSTGSGVLNRTTGVLTITGSIALTSIIYFPDLPVMGLEELILTPTQFPGTIAFDTDYAYNISTSFPYPITDVSFYKNPTTGPAGYIPKGTLTPVTWNGQDYQQFWTVNYQGALWATNGINVPFSITNIGMQFAPASSITYISNTATTITVTIAGNPLVVGDFVFFNEWTGASAAALNLQSGYVTVIAGANITITLPNATLPVVAYVPGIIQYLTNRSDVTKDVIRWYDGDPIGDPGHGWVNFMPPLSNLPYSIADLPPLIYYLVGARMIIPYKDHLLFLGPVVQSSAGNPIYLQDTILWSQNGTPYYTASFSGSPIATTTIFHEILVPINQTAAPNAYFEDVPGYGGFVSAGIAQPILTAGFNEDVLIVGFSNRQTRFIYSGNELEAFDFFFINAELGSGSTFSVITLDRGIITTGEHGIIQSNQVGSQRIDLDIPDQIFEFVLLNNGNERVTAQRDFINEWIYITYPSNEEKYKFPNQTLQYNYREGTWAVHNEAYTTYGKFKRQSGYTWATVGLTFPTWSVWNNPWNSGASTLLQQQVIAGNQQGFIIFRDEGTFESVSLMITNIVVAGPTTITSPNHTLNEGDYIIISGVLGTLSTQVNGNIYQVGPPITANTFNINPGLTAGTYLGGGLIKRMYIPRILTRQFPVAWGLGKKTRIGAQQYLFTTTPNGQLELQIYLSQNSDAPYNAGPFVPMVNSQNDSLVYTDTIFTSPDLPISTLNNFSLGLIGNGILTTILQSFPYPLIPGSLIITIGNVATFADNGIGGFNVTGTGVMAGSAINYTTGVAVLVFSLAPSAQLSSANFQFTQINIQSPTAAQQDQIWHRMNTSLIGDTVQIGFTLNDMMMRDPTFSNQFEEIEIHGFSLAVSQSQSLS